MLCELADGDPDTAVDAVASALGIERRPGRRTDERLAAVIGAARSSLLLDNCEHVLEPVAELVERCSPVAPTSWS